MTREVETAKRVITTFLGTGSNGESMYDLYEINHGNKKMLLEHTKALASIFSVAYADLLREVENDNKTEIVEN